MFHLSLNPIFESYGLVALVAFLLTLALWFGPSKEKTSRRQRTALVLLRAVVVGLVLLAMLRPTLIYTQTKKQAATLVVLADRSRSMSVPDAADNKTRWKAMRDALDKAAPDLARLQNDFELKAYTFDAEPREVGVEAGRLLISGEPDGRQTAIGGALAGVLDREARKRLLGVILLSDGAQRTEAGRDLPPQTAAARLRNAGCPLFTVPFGESRGLGEARDVAVENLTANPNVFVNNELAVRGRIRVDGYKDVDIPVRLLAETLPGKMEVVARRAIRATTDGQLLSVSFRYAPRTPGEQKLTIEVAPQPGELVATNNAMSTFVDVLAGGVKVLYLEGALRVEEKFLRRAIDSSPDMKIDYVRLAPGGAANRPADLADRFAPGRYDVYILGDVDSTAFRQGELARLARCVEGGAGLIMLGGLQTFGPGGYDGTPLARLLPVGMEPIERQRPDEAIRADIHWPGPLKMRPTSLGLNHFAMALAAGRAKNEAAWAKLPPLEGANKFHDLAPGAIVLADASPDQPLLVVHSFGNGRVAAFACDSTWRWWMRGFEPEFKRFWRQMILWLARKDAGRDGAVWVDLGQRRLAPGEKLDFSVAAMSPTNEPIADADFRAEALLPDGTRRPLTLARQNDRMTGSFGDTQAVGDYAILVVATRQGVPLGKARSRFLVFQQDLEMDNPSADSATMESLAAMTGGRSSTPDQLPELVRRLVEETKSLDVRQETKKTFWDTWLFFLTIVALLSAEWWLRKRWGLV